MKIKDAINMANLMESGNVMPKELAILFLSELDGMIQSDIMLHAPEEIVSYTDEEQELLLRPPHDKLYVHYLVMMIRNQQQEHEGYQNSQESVDEKLKTFRRWYVSHYRPADTNSRSYTGGTSADGFGFAYLSAYGLAVKHGYQGSEEEWLQSLKGAKGDAGEAARMRYDAERDMIQWGVGDEWHDLYTMAEVLAPLYAKLDEMTGRAEEAAERAAQEAKAANQAANTAAGYATAAGGHAKTAADAAADALGSAGQAYASEQTAVTAAGDAQVQAEAAGGYAERAEQAAERAEEAAGAVPEWARQPQKPSYTAQEVGADPAGEAANVITGHTTDRYSHNDIRVQIQTLTDRISLALNSTDEELDQLAEIVAYIRSNKSLIDAITTSKVSVADIVDNLVTNLSDRPLSAAMGVELKRMLDQTASRIGDALEEKLDKTGLDGAIQEALAQAQESGEFDGAPGSSGYTPVKGVDYFTPEEIQEVAQQAAELVEFPEGGGKSAWTLCAEVATEEEVAYCAIAIPEGFTNLYVYIEIPVASDAYQLYAKAWSKADKIKGDSGESLLTKLSATASKTLVTEFYRLGEKTKAVVSVDAMYPPNGQLITHGGKWGDVTGNYFVLSTQYGNGVLPVGTKFYLYGR